MEKIKKALNFGILSLLAAITFLLPNIAMGIDMPTSLRKPLDFNDRANTPPRYSELLRVASDLPLDISNIMNNPIDSEYRMNEWLNMVYGHIDTVERTVIRFQDIQGKWHEGRLLKSIYSGVINIFDRLENREVYINVRDVKFTTLKISVVLADKKGMEIILQNSYIPPWLTKQEELRKKGSIREIRMKTLSGDETSANKINPTSAQLLPDGKLVVGDNSNFMGAAIYFPDGKVIFLNDENGNLFTGDKTVSTDYQGNIFVVTSKGIIRRYSQGGELLDRYVINVDSYMKSRNMPTRLTRDTIAINVYGMIAFENKLYYTIHQTGEFRVLDLESGEEKIFGEPEDKGTYIETRQMSLSIDKTRRLVYITDPGYPDIAQDIPGIPMRMRTFNVDTQEYSPPKDLPMIYDTGGVAVDNEGTIYISDKDRSIIHVYNQGAGYIGYFTAPDGEAVFSIDTHEDNLILGIRGKVVTISKEAILEMLVKPPQDTASDRRDTNLLIASVSERKPHINSDTARMDVLEKYGIYFGRVTMLPALHGQLEVLSRFVDMHDLIRLVVGSLGEYEGEPHFVSAPIYFLPKALQKLLKMIQVQPIDGGKKSLYEYVRDNVDEIIFTPYLIDVDNAGNIAQLGGAVIHHSMSEPIEQLSFISNPDRPGKRIIYISLSKFWSKDEKGLIHVEKLATSRLQPISEVDCISHIIEETAHMETMKLVFKGTLSSRYYDRPGLLWFEKIGATIKLNSLESLRAALKQLFPDRSLQVDGFITAYKIEARNKIVGLNRVLGEPEDDFRYLYGAPSLPDMLNKSTEEYL